MEKDKKRLKSKKLSKKLHTRRGIFTFSICVVPILICFIFIMPSVSANPCPIYGMAQYGDDAYADGAKVEVTHLEETLNTTVGPVGSWTSGFWQVDCGDPFGWPQGTHFTVVITGSGEYSSWSGNTSGTVSGNFIDVGTIILFDTSEGGTFHNWTDPFDNNDSNVPPVADASANEPYTSLVEESIIFNGSRSYDSDGTIINWNWNFDDGNNDTGEIVTYAYSIPGIYNVTLKVTDDQGAVDVYYTSVVINECNIPPSNPTLKGPTSGNINAIYLFTVVSADPDNDMIRYIVDWGDETNNTLTDFVQNNTLVNVTHKWETAGVYIVKAYAKDKNNATSDINENIVIIDVNVRFINDSIKGYFVDYEKDDIYDFFYDNETNSNITIEKQADGTYLLDIYGDGSWDYMYNTTGYLSTYQEKNKETPCFELIIVLYAMFITIFLKRKRKS